MRTAGWVVVASGLAAAVALSGCGRPAGARERPRPVRRVVASFAGEVDVAAGTLALGPLQPGEDGVSSAPLEEIEVVQDGQPGVGPPDTVELVTLETATFAGGCGAVDAFWGHVELRSFFAGHVLQNVYVEIVSITPTGREACNSSPPVPGVSDEHGLFAYGALGAAGTQGDSALADWAFRLPDTTRFTFTGRVMADLVDVAPPRLLSIAPGDEGTGVPVSAGVTVTFSERMEAASVAAAFVLRGPQGPVSGTMVEGAGNAWVFTPAAPLELATRYTIELSADAADVGGWRLEEGHRSSFSTVVPPSTVTLDGGGVAAHLLEELAQDAAGNRLAVAEVLTSSGAGLAWAYHDAALGAWRPQVMLHEVRTPAGAASAARVDARVAAGGQGFLVLWRNTADGVVRSTVFTDGVPGPVKVHGSQGSLPMSAAANDGGGYAILAGRDGCVGADVFDGSTWTSATLTCDAHVSRLVPLGADSWLAASSGDAGVAAHRWRPAGRSWSVQSLDWPVSGPVAVASRGDHAIVAVAEPWVAAAIDPGRGFFDGLDDVATSPPGVAVELDAAASADGFALAWRTEADGGALGVTYDPGTSTWSAPAALTAQAGPVSAIRLVPAGDGFATLLGIGERLEEAYVGPLPGHAWVNHDPFAAANELEARALPVGQHGVAAWGEPGGAALLGWSHAGEASGRAEVATFDGVQLGPSTPVSLPDAAGSASQVRLAADANGQVLAVWQEDAGFASAVHGAFRRRGAWAEPFTIASRCSAPAVASDGEGFLVACEHRPDATIPFIRTIRHTGGAWQAPVDLGSVASPQVQPAVASDGSSYLVAWFSLDGGGAALLEPAGWDTFPLAAGPGAARVESPAVAARPTAGGGTYVVAWRQEAWGGVSVHARVLVRSWGTVSFGASVSLGSGATGGPAVASAPDGSLAVAWTDAGAGRVALHSGGAWGAAAAVVSRPSCTIAGISATAGDWLAAFDCGGLWLARHAGGTWAAAASQGVRALELALASDSRDHRLLARTADGAGASLHLIEVLDGVFQAPVEVADGALAPAGRGISVVRDAAWTAAWAQQGQSAIADRVNARSGL